MPAILAAFVSLAVSFGPAAAQDSTPLCHQPASLEQAVAEGETVLVGVATATRGRGRVATVRVERIWKGEAPAEIEVHGGANDESPLTTDDRIYATGIRYLLFIHRLSEASFEDSQCSSTQVFTAETAAVEPATAHEVDEPQPPPPPDTSEQDLRSGIVFFIVVGGLFFLGFGTLAIPDPKQRQDLYVVYSNKAASVMWRVGLGMVVTGALAYLVVILVP